MKQRGGVIAIQNGHTTPKLGKQPALSATNLALKINQTIGRVACPHSSKCP